MEHEDYVSLETAKLLKQAGFDWKIYDGYILYEDGGSFVTEFQTPHDFNGNNGDLFNNYLHHKEVLSRPTLAVAQKWLGSDKSIDAWVSIDADYSFKKGIYEKKYVGFIFDNKTCTNIEEDTKYAGSYTCYEQALEAAIKLGCEYEIYK